MFARLRRLLRSWRTIRAEMQQAHPERTVNCLNCADFDDFHDGDRLGYCMNERTCAADIAAGYGGHWTNEEAWCPEWSPADQIKPSRGPPVDDDDLPHNPVSGVSPSEEGS